MKYSYTEIITPKESIEKLGDVTYDPYGLMPAALPSHPRVIYHSNRLERTRQLMVKGGMMQRACDVLCETARGVTIPDSILDTPDAATVNRVGNGAEQNALAFHLTGDRSFLDRALQALTVFAQAYPAWPTKRGFRTGLGGDLPEAPLIKALASAYDLIAAAGPLSAAQKTLFDELMEACVATGRTSSTMACGNHNLGTLVGRLSAAAMLGNRQYIHDVLYGVQDPDGWRYGLIHSLRHDILADGLHWERTSGYHWYVLHALAELLDQCTGIGIDLWHRELPAQMQNDGDDIHRAYGPMGGKSVKAAFDATFFRAYANGDLARLHDSSLNTLSSGGGRLWGITYALAYEAFRDPRYAWLINKFEESKLSPVLPGLSMQLPFWRAERDFARLTHERYPAGRFDLERDVRIGQVGFHTRRCSVFPVAGMAVLRSAEGPAASLFWGPHSAGHLDPAALCLDIHTGSGRVTDSLTTVPYNSPLHLNWCRTTIAHNTVSVDGTSMLPYEHPTKSPWECDHWRDMTSDGTLHSHQFEKQFKIIRASNDRVYTGIMLDRTILVTDDEVIDLFRVSSHKRHTYDLAYHIAGTLHGIEQAKPAKLSGGRGYELITDIRRIPAAADGTPLLFSLVSGETWQGILLSPTKPQLFTGRDPALSQPMLGEVEALPPLTALIARQNASQAVYVTHWSKVIPGQKPATVRLLPAKSTGDIVIEITRGKARKTWTLPADPNTIFNF